MTGNYKHKTLKIKIKIEGKKKGNLSINTIIQGKQRDQQHMKWKDEKELGGGGKATEDTGREVDGE